MFRIWGTCIENVSCRGLVVKPQKHITMVFRVWPQNLAAWFWRESKVICGTTVKQLCEGRVVITSSN